MRTLVISDLHLGAAQRTDLLRRSDLRAPLLEALTDVDRLVILGDGLELREAAQRDAATLAAPFFAAVGRALGPDGELLLLAGNHDHGLVAGWIDGRLQSERSGFLGLSEPVTPEQAGPLAQRIAEHAAPARVRLAYPGVWLRDDVYAIHGHYADLHSTVPTFERLAAGAMARWIVRLPRGGARPDDYEAALAPLYAFMHQLTQRSDHGAISAGAGASARAWVVLAGHERRTQPLRAALLGAGYAGAVGLVNALGLGPVDRSLSGAALRRGGLRGIAEVIERLGIGAPYVVWGHSHRSGPWPGDDLSEWVTPSGTRIVNAGSWVYQPHFLSGAPNISPYWPGTAVELDGDAPPRLVRLLGDMSSSELAPPELP